MPSSSPAARSVHPEASDPLRPPRGARRRTCVLRTGIGRRPSAVQIAFDMKNKPSRLVTAACLALPLSAVTQASFAGPATPEPSSLRYESAFADYKPWQEIQPGDWRAINDALGKGATGHSEHGAAPAGGTSAGPAAKPARPQQAPMPGHEAHHMDWGQK